MTGQRRRASASSAHATTLLVTNLIKLGGLAVGVHEGFTTKNSVVMIVATFMMAGAQASEAVLLAMLDRILGSGDSHEDR